ncbi:hypothetical protein QZM75_35390 [Burkholderia cenocepacia]|nr:hypothetical protein [Burkholderia cenocepacia]MDN7549486.1 hypothetical protein [Burkholderia cenocepacia]MDN7631687.1 hypothetical protein [Burkholderia cenocepacia]
MANFTKDQVIFRGEGKFRIVRVQDDITQLENTVTGEFSHHSEADLLEEYLRGYLRTTTSKQYQRAPKHRTVKDALEASVSAGASGDFETRRRVNYLVMLDRMDAFSGRRSALRKAIQKVAIDLADPTPPHETTVYRWRRRYRIAQFDIRALLDQSEHRGGKGQSRLDPIVEGIIHEKIETAFLNSKRGTAEEVYNAVFLEIARKCDHADSPSSTAGAPSTSERIQRPASCRSARQSIRMCNRGPRSSSDWQPPLAAPSPTSTRGFVSANASRLATTSNTSEYTAKVAGHGPLSYTSSLCNHAGTGLGSDSTAMCTVHAFIFATPASTALRRM